MRISIMRSTLSRCLLLLVASLLSAQAVADRIKDMATVAGLRSNRLGGHGLVVGRDGHGDEAPFTNQTFRNLMERLGITIPRGVGPKLKNGAGGSVHAETPAFAKPGQRIDSTVSSLRNAKSLRGGSL